MDTDSPFTGEFSTPEAHFDDELFVASQSRIKGFKTQIISLITKDKPDGDAARKLLGRALHTLQDFYSHSTWVDRGNGEPYADIITGTLINPAPSLRTCLDDQATPAAGVPLTSGYFIGNCGNSSPAPAGKCLHGLNADFKKFGVTICTAYAGINKDDGSRAKHAEAVAVAGKATTAYVKAILDDPLVSGNEKAIKALMTCGPTLAFAIDDTGSMGNDIAQVKAEVRHIVNNVRDTAKAPSQYLLVRFGDPDVGDPVSTSDPDEFLAAVNALWAHGGGDCPELSQTALFRAVSASRDNSTVYLFTDASAKDSGQASTTTQTAQAKSIQITALLTGTCSPIDPAYIMNTEETGGQLFFLSKFDVGQTFDLVKPQLEGDLGTIMLRKSSLGNTPQDFVFQVDSSVSRIVVSASAAVLDGASLVRPSGTPVTDTDPGVTMAVLESGIIITVDAPEAGAWTLSVSGFGAITARVLGNSPIQLSRFDWVVLENPVHPGFFPISGQPAGDVHSALARISGSAATAFFTLVDESGNMFQNIDLQKGRPYAQADDYSGDVALPTVPFRVVVSGVDSNATPYERVLPKLFRLRNFRVTPDAPSMPPGLIGGKTTSMGFVVQNIGPRDSYAMSAVADSHVGTVVHPNRIELDSGASLLLQVDLSVPTSTRPGTFVTCTVSAQSESDVSARNSATVVLPVLAARGDVDGDGDVDRDDLAIILAARNQPASGPDDPRDLDKDGRITALDARILVTLFTRVGGATK